MRAARSLLYCSDGHFEAAYSCREPRPSFTSSSEGAAMATKIYFVPYVRGPELDIDAAKPPRTGAVKNWFKKVRMIGRAVLTSPDRPSTPARAEARSHWAFRVVNYRPESAMSEKCQCQPQAPVAVEVCDLELEAISPAQLRRKMSSSSKPVRRSSPTAQSSREPPSSMNRPLRANPSHWSAPPKRGRG